MCIRDSFSGHSVKKLSVFTGIADHYEVCQSLKTLSDRELRDLGGALGLAYPNLLKMTQLPHEMVAAWLNRQDDVLTRGGEPTWKGLAEALKKVGQTGVAEDIRRTKCQDSGSCTERQQQNLSVEMDSSTGIQY